MASELPAQLTSIETEVQNRFKNLSTGFQKLDRVKDVSKQSKQLDELTAKMREAKRYVACGSYVKSRAGANWEKADG
ncbi:unnamed protein product [Sphagnum troendelagicum]|uniref:Prefoldin subunit 5 n=1 Tax=Sphagnum troendelagicum TaxID=128251 RepID=A0ABP0UJA2_9BRYO